MLERYDESELKLKNHYEKIVAELEQSMTEKKRAPTVHQIAEQPPLLQKMGSF